MALHSQAGLKDQAGLLHFLQYHSVEQKHEHQFKAGACRQIDSLLIAEQFSLLCSDSAAYTLTYYE